MPGAPYIGSIISEPRDHHFIPAFYLSQWAGPNGKLIEYSRKHGKLIAKPVGPRATGFETDLYEFADLPPEQRQYLEKVYFNYLDRTAADGLDIHLGRASTWTNELVNAWSRFVFGTHFRHPHAMPELRAAAKAIWEGSGVALQAEWDKIKPENAPATFDEYLATVDPFTAAKMRVNLIIKNFDNETLIVHMNQMHWGVLDAPASAGRILTSDRPVCIDKLARPDGVIFLPISPTKLFLAANDEKSLKLVAAQKPLDMVERVNRFVAGRARRFVWADSEAQENFVGATMSTEMEPLPLFPNIGKYPSAA
ncbi:DUF4238 domain-containing protein [Bradyrhizobium sp. 35]|uniref:DUF4238 domain-containing protein n=1 Tax=Bradyrhizobium sp. 35 TaxID=2782670 RepID=UPI001FFA6737|nr:DUF4238 domain-containing protein [Bradyrhizobium sp. 35]MCK1455198.1 DUF4238 domain-containing protein [Bradyrhizobium sp. 35]